MAIKIDLQSSQFGIPFQGAYFRIVSATAKRGESENPKFVAIIDVCGYGNSSPEMGTSPIDFRRYGTPLEDIEAQAGATFLDRCYAWVMAQPDMAGSSPA